jgi:PAS domain S-box-containing protein
MADKPNKTVAATDNSAQQLAELNALHNFSKIVNQSLSVSETTRLALKEISSVSEADLVMLYQRDGDRLNLLGQYSDDSRYNNVLPQTKNVGECLCGLAGLGEIVFSININTDNRCTLLECKEAGFHSFVAIPLISHDEILGVIGIASTAERDFSVQQRFFETMAGHLAMALNNSMLYEQAKLHADELENKIQALKESDEKILKSETDFRELADMLPQIVFELDSQGNVIYVNQQAFKATGFDENDVAAGVNAFELVVEKDRERLAVNVRRVLNGEVLGGNEYEMSRKDGSTFPALIYSSRRVEKDGQDGLRGIIIDNTEQKAKEEILRQEEEKYRTCLQNFRGIMFQGKLDFSPIVFQGAVEEITGHIPQDFQDGKITWDKVIHADDLSELKGSKELREVPNYSCERVYRIVRKDGGIRWVEEHIHNICDAAGKPYLVMGSILDITRRKASEAKLSESEARFAAVIENLPFDIFALDKSNRFILQNTNCRNNWGGIIGKQPHELGLDAELLALFEENNRRAFAGETVRIEETITNIKGEKQNIINILSPIMSNGEVRSIVGVNIDITNLRKTEEKLKKSEELYRSLVENIDIGVTLISKDHTILMVNRAQGEMFDLPPESFIGKKCFREFEKREHVCDHCPGTVAMKNGTVQEEITDGIREDGSSIRVRIRAFPLTDIEDNPIGFIEVVEDISERLKLEEEIKKTQKLESLGVLAGGLAHDFNNLLTGILGNITLAQLHMSPEEKANEYIKSAEKATIRATGLTKQLLTFSKGGDPLRQNLDPVRLIQDATTFSLSGSNVRAEFDLEGELLPINVDPGQISQVFQNIVINADQAMPTGGIIKISARNIDVADNQLPPLKSGKYVRIDFHDQGTGIPEQHISQVFDPYFSTKQKGNGLGLAICYSIIKKHDGLITVESKPDHGALFMVYLPASGKVVRSTDKETEELPMGQGKILVMDDEDFILDVASQVLALLGYDSETARDGQEAIAMFKKARDDGKPFDALIMDLTVPGGMGGEQAIKAILAIDQDVRAIVSSGYTDDPILSEHEKYGFSGVAVKPYRAQTLGKVLKAILSP